MPAQSIRVSCGHADGALADSKEDPDDSDQIPDRKRPPLKTKSEKYMWRDTGCDWVSTQYVLFRNDQLLKALKYK